MEHELVPPNMSAMNGQDPTAAGNSTHGSLWRRDKPTCTIFAAFQGLQQQDEGGKQAGRVNGRQGLMRLWDAVVLNRQAKQPQRKMSLMVQK